MYVDAHKRGARQYADVHTSSGLGEDSPHRLIQMLMEGFLARVNSAKGAIAHHDMEAKSIYISKAIGIVGGLNEAVDLERGGEIAANLRQLYDYMNIRLLEASRENSEDKLNEVATLMRDIKEAWDAIA
ncbi:flagellar export chaperone FliS [Methylomonas sp. MED-D]|uniref:Flagellar secretion chaperone FliS n=1 Tax=Methylomonas koyamae TaxID=702114 RepID=A0A177NCT7_9GAMM|nr:MULTISPECIES: flagellar export chaperone FliS [Methylomonas]MDT4332514.1 flagellar export chaperone FliS [Methylomonas sp. MV1]NJA07714.1 flagellar export chaperone FliS [Methylococcaceae bacterium WWC4]OAI15253.1 flagellar protein FliS [Methylomonas koyamae]OHX34669.1 flagellar export chaperone FliS [Methylomonas sp. LWB]